MPDIQIVDLDPAALDDDAPTEPDLSVSIETETAAISAVTRSGDQKPAGSDLPDALVGMYFTG